MNVAPERIDSPIRIVPSEPLSLEEFWQFSADNRDLRIQREPNGELIVMPPTTRETGFHSACITRALGNWSEEDGRGYDFAANTGFLLPDGSVRSPAAAWVSGRYWQAHFDEEVDPCLCPQFVIELRSKIDRLSTLQARMEAWTANGVELGWLIDPSRKTVEIHRPGQPVEIQEGQLVIYGDNPVQGFALDLARIWA